MRLTPNTPLLFVLALSFLLCTLSPALAREYSTGRRSGNSNNDSGIKYMSIPPTDGKSSYGSIKMLKAWSEKLASMYPDVVSLSTARERFFIDSVGTCGFQDDWQRVALPCDIFIIEVGPKSLSGFRSDSHNGANVTEDDTTDFNPLLGNNNKSKRTNSNESAESTSLPSVFFSGTIHGNEVVGPEVVIALTELLLSGYKQGDSWMTRMVTTRKTVLIPALNAVGWDKKTRKEETIDPNRDFPHDQPKKCLLTQAAKATNALFRTHSFSTCVTFHNGIDLIGYPWGDIQHDKNHISPDDKFFEDTAKIMSRVAGSAGEGRLYEYGVLAENPYSVPGGFEDWAYAASWSNQTSTTCEMFRGNGNTDNKDRKREMGMSSNYPPDSNRCMVYLVETSMAKEPAEETLGSWESNMLMKDTEGDGHVPRNVRLSLMMIDMARPYIQLVKIALLEKGNSGDGGDLSIVVSYAVGGCLIVDSTDVSIVVGDAIITKSSTKQGPCIWNENMDHSMIDPFRHPHYNVELKINKKGRNLLDGKFKIVIRANVDMKYTIPVAGADPAGEPMLLNIRRNSVTEGVKKRTRTYITTAHIQDLEDLKQNYDTVFQVTSGEVAGTQNEGSNVMPSLSGNLIKKTKRHIPAPQLFLFRGEVLIFIVIIIVFLSLLKNCGYKSVSKRTPVASNAKKGKPVREKTRVPRLVRP